MMSVGNQMPAKASMKKTSNSFANNNTSSKTDQYQLITQQSVSSSGTDGSKTDLNNIKLRYNDSCLFNNNSYQQQSVLQSSVGVTFDFSNQNTNSIPFSYQVTSMNETKAKQISKKRPMDVIW